MVWQGPRALLATPIDSTHPLQAMCIRQLQTCMHTTIAALISMQTDVDADAMCDGYVLYKAQVVS